MLTERWRKSTRSGDGGNCLEARLRDGTVEVRDTKDRAGGKLHFSASDWSALVKEIKADTSG